jgi:hypothetical protein
LVIWNALVNILLEVGGKAFNILIKKVIKLLPDLVT